MTRYFGFFLFIVLVLLLAACGQFGYYSQSLSGHLSIMTASRPIDDILSDPDITDTLKQKLARALEYRRYASEELKLPENESYLSYVDLGRSAAVWNVVAAPDDSLTPKQWCFAFVGCLPYRGYYDQAEAKEYAAELDGQGYDTLTYGVPAYSTLGWFDDPLLSTLVDLPDWALAGIMFHELAHQVVYVEDDTLFNEAFAQMVEEEGWRRWSAQYGSDEQRALYRDYRTRHAGFQALLKQTRDALQLCYVSDKEHADRIECKQRALAQMQRRYLGLKKSWDGYSGYDEWFESPPNNAHFVSSHTYRHLVPAFESLLRRQDGDLQRFYDEVKRLADLPFQQRQQFMESLLLSGDEGL